MLAAKLRHKDLVSSVVRSNRFDGTDDMDFLAELIHSRNATGQTLLAMVALQGKLTKVIDKVLNILQGELKIVIKYSPR